MTRRRESSSRPVAMVIGPLPPPFGGVGVLVDAILRSPLGRRWELQVFNLSKPQQEGKPSTVTVWDVIWTVWHLLALPVRLLRARPRVALVESTADTGFFRDLALALECRLLGVPVVLHWHGAPDSPQFPGASRWRRALFRFGTRLAAGVIVAADPYRDFFVRYVDPARLFVVPNFTDGEVFTPAPVPRPEETIRALFVGRVGPQKGVDILLEALTRARDEVPALRAVLVGAGETETAWQEAVQHPLVAAGVVELTGRIGHRERVEQFRRADLLILPTRTDAFPVTVLEAMASGLPVIASDVGAIGWMMGDGECGVLVPPGDADRLTRALVSLATDREQRRAMGARGRRRHDERFDVRVVADLLDRVLATASGAGPEPPDTTR